MTQNNLGNALAELGKLENDAEQIKQAITAIQSVAVYFKTMGNSQYDRYFEEKLKSLNLMLNQ
jgi:hypothetical protein